MQTDNERFDAPTTDANTRYSSSKPKTGRRIPYYLWLRTENSQDLPDEPFRTPFIIQRRVILHTYMPKVRVISRTGGQCEKIKKTEFRSLRHPSLQSLLIMSCDDVHTKQQNANLEPLNDGHSLGTLKIPPRGQNSHVIPSGDTVILAPIQRRRTSHNEADAINNPP